MGPDPREFVGNDVGATDKAHKNLFNWYWTKIGSATHNRFVNDVSLVAGCCVRFSQRFMFARYFELPNWFFFHVRHDTLPIHVH